jgi:hypothetical protein
MDVVDYLFLGGLSGQIVKQRLIMHLRHLHLLRMPCGFLPLQGEELQLLRDVLVILPRVFRATEHNKKLFVIRPKYTTRCIKRVWVNHWLETAYYWEAENDVRCSGKHPTFVKSNGPLTFLQDPATELSSEHIECPSQPHTLFPFE